MLAVIPLWDRCVPRTVLKHWQSWLSRDNHMTITWLSHDNHMTITWLFESVVILQVWPGNTTFPDFTHPAIGTYWSEQLASFHENISFDGLWIDMNEPSNFIPGSTEGCPVSTYNSPPFLPGRCCMYTCKYVHTYVSMYYVCMYVCMYVYMYVCMYVCRYVCVHVCIYVST